MINKLDYLQVQMKGRDGMDQWHHHHLWSLLNFSQHLLIHVILPSVFPTHSWLFALTHMDAKTSMHHTQHNRRVRSPALCMHQHVNHGNPHMGVNALGPYQPQNICPLCWVCTLLVPVTHTDKSNRNIHTVSHWLFCNTAHSINNTNPERHIT